MQFTHALLKSKIAKEVIFQTINKNNNSGKLFIGVKLNMKNEPILFSKFKNEYRGEYFGMDISGVDFNSNDSIDKCIKISLEKLKTEGVLNYSNNNY